MTLHHLILGHPTQWKTASGQPKCNKGQSSSRGNIENIIIYLPQNYNFIVFPLNRLIIKTSNITLKGLIPENYVSVKQEYLFTLKQCAAHYNLSTKLHIVQR